MIIIIRLPLFLTALIIITLMDLVFIRIISLNFKQDYLITKKDFNEMKDWTFKTK